MLAACQRGNQHHQSGLRQMEVCDQAVQNLEFVTRMDKDIGQPLPAFKIPSSPVADSMVLQLVVPTQITRPPAAL